MPEHYYKPTLKIYFIAKDSIANLCCVFRKEVIDSNPLYSRLHSYQLPGNEGQCNTLYVANPGMVNCIVIHFQAIGNIAIQLQYCQPSLPLLYSSKMAIPRTVNCIAIQIEAIGKGGRVIMAGCRRGVAEILPRTTVIIEYKIRVS